MHGFVSHFTNKVDAKGRVSIPAQFRQVLARDGYEGVYCFPSPSNATIDAGGNALLTEIGKQLEGVDGMTAEYDLLAAAFYGESDTLRMDAEGRVILPETFREHTGITNSALLVGLRHKFQIWEPSRYAVHREEAKKTAYARLTGRSAEVVSG